jgi:hypothetical protein
VLRARAAPVGHHLATAFLVILGATARAAPLVPWREAEAHVGETVTVEGDVIEARTAGDTCVLEFADDPRAFRALLLLPLLSDLPPDPAPLYRRRRVRLTGRVQRFQGRPEMVLRGPGQIELLADARTEAPPGPADARATAPTPVGGCAQARARWRDTAAAARVRTAALDRCLQTPGYRCAGEAAALAPALSELEGAERLIAEACP